MTRDPAILMMMMRMMASVVTSSDLALLNIVVYAYLAWCSWRIVVVLFTPSAVLLLLAVVVSCIIIIVAYYRYSSYTVTAADQWWTTLFLLVGGIISANSFCPGSTPKKKKRQRSSYSYIIRHLLYDVLAVLYCGFGLRGLVVFGLGITCGYYALPSTRAVYGRFQWSIWLAIIMAAVTTITAVVAWVGGGMAAKPAL
jgi:hypothetical protein